MTMLRNAGSLKNDKKFNMREIVIDTETTGLDPLDGHRIIEIGAVELVNRCPTGNTFHRYLCRECTMRADAIAVHGLTAEFLADKPLFAAVTDEFLAFVGDAPLVAHNAGFDIAFLNAELQRAARSPIAIERVDWCWRGASILADVFEDIRKRLAMGEPSDRTGHRIQFRRIRRDFGSARTCQNFVDQAAHRTNASPAAASPTKPATRCERTSRGLRPALQLPVSCS
jgi:hypothetical protein